MHVRNRCSCCRVGMEQPPLLHSYCLEQINTLSEKSLGCSYIPFTTMQSQPQSQPPQQHAQAISEEDAAGLLAYLGPEQDLHAHMHHLPTRPTPSPEDIQRLHDRLKTAVVKKTT